MANGAFGAAANMAAGLERSTVLWCRLIAKTEIGSSQILVLFSNALTVTLHLVTNQRRTTNRWVADSFEMTRLLTILISLFVTASGICAQAVATPDGFHGLTLNETTRQNVIDALGQPETDKTDSLDGSKLDKWLDAKHKEKIFRQLTYKNRDFTKIELSFLDDKLVMIDLTFGKRFEVQKLSNLFAVEFAGLGGPISLPDKPGQMPGGFLATSYPAYYTKVAISDKTFLIANCASEGGGSSPGRVERTRQISRGLERK